MDKDTILDYVTETPGNTNRVVLSGMLDSMGGGGSGQPLMVHLTTEDGLLFTFDKTFGEIYDAIQAGQLPILESSYSDGSIETVQKAIITNAVIEHQYIGQEDETYTGTIVVSLNPYHPGFQLENYEANGNTLEVLRTNYPYCNFSD